jgi:phytoene dehydrogenase-like protein
VSHDAIVIGAGVNGLVAAHYLARASRRVLVLERAAAPDESPDAGWIPPPVIRELGLAAHGVRVERPDPWMAAALPDGGRLELFADPARSADAIRRFSPGDASRWPEFVERTRRLAMILETLYSALPPDVRTREPAELLRLARLALSVRRLGKQAVVDLLRVLPMSVAELLDDWFETDALKGVLAAAGVLHLRQGPRSGGTAFGLLHHHVGSPPGVFRPPRSNLAAVLARLPGVEIRRDAEVTQIRVTAGRVRGVVLGSGEELAAPLVASSADPRRTVLGMLDAGWLDPEQVAAMRNVKCRGVVARVTLSSDRAVAGDLAVVPSMEYLERAYDDAKYGRASTHPYVETSARNGTIAAHVQYAPYHLADGAWDAERRRALGETVIGTLETHVPDLRGRVAVREVLTPLDLEERYGVTEGHLYHGELTLDQILFMRPVPGWSRYRTPIGGLYLCGAGTHPGGAVAGGPGRHAARVMLEEMRR